MSNINEKSSEKTQPQTEAQRPRFPLEHTLSHVADYPVVASALSIVDNRDYRVVSLLHSIYARASPVAYAIASRPYSFVAPYVDSADDFFVEYGLKTVDSKFPVVRGQPEEVQQAARNAIAWPFATARRGLESISSQISVDTNAVQGYAQKVAAVVHQKLGEFINKAETAVPDAK